MEKKSPDVSVQAPATAAPTVTRAVNAVAEPAPPSQSTTPVDGYVPKRRLARDHISIKATPVVDTTPEAVALDTDEGPDLASATKEVNQALLAREWTEYALARKREGKNSLHATLAAKAPTVSGPSAITFAIVNDVQEKYMRDEKPTLLSHLRRQLGDPALQLEVVKEAVVTKPRYTKLDRFNLMAEKNPALLKLRQELDLDLG